MPMENTTYEKIMHDAIILVCWRLIIQFMMQVAETRKCVFRVARVAINYVFYSISNIKIILHFTVIHRSCS